MEDLTIRTKKGKVAYRLTKQVEKVLDDMDDQRLIQEGVISSETAEAIHA